METDGPSVALAYSLHDSSSPELIHFCSRCKKPFTEGWCS